MLPPKLSLVVTETTRASISSFGFNVKKLLLSQWDGRAIIGGYTVYLDEVKPRLVLAQPPAGNPQSDSS